MNVREDKIDASVNLVRGFLLRVKKKTTTKKKKKRNAESMDRS